MSADALSTTRAARAAGKLNLLGMPAATLVELFETLGEKSYRAKQVMQWLYQRHVTDFDAMTDLSASLRKELGAITNADLAARAREGAFRRRHAQVALERRRGSGRRDGVHSRAGPRHAMHLVAGGLRARLCVLRDGPSGLQPQSHVRRDLGAGRARVAGARVNADHERRVHGHGRAARELSQRAAGRADSARRHRVRPVAPSSHDQHRGRRAADRQARDRLQRRARGVAARADGRASRPARADQQDPSDRGAARVVLAVRARISRAARSRSNTCCSTA